MKYRCFAFLLSMVLMLASPALATTVKYWLSVDDYAKLSIDGNQVAYYNGSPWVYLYFTLNLTPGWHNFDLDYGNKGGSNALYFYQQYPDEAGYSLVPLDNFRSLDRNGATISGLHADYYDTVGGPLITTVYGEGPIANGWSHTYQDVQYPNDNYWAGIYGDWSSFEEHLTGQIFVASTPEPASLGLLGLGLGIVGVFRRKLAR